MRLPRLTIETLDKLCRDFRKSSLQTLLIAKPKSENMRSKCRTTTHTASCAGIQNPSKKSTKQWPECFGVHLFECSCSIYIKCSGRTHTALALAINDADWQLIVHTLCVPLEKSLHFYRTWSLFSFARILSIKFIAKRSHIRTYKLWVILCIFTFMNVSMW